MSDNRRHPATELALLALIMALSIGGGLIGWRIAHYVGDAFESATHDATHGATDISSRSRSPQK